MSLPARARAAPARSRLARTGLPRLATTSPFGADPGPISERDDEERRAARAVRLRIAPERQPEVLEQAGMDERQGEAAQANCAASRRIDPLPRITSITLPIDAR